jgi:DNA-binding transcriptional ArsR family regulator
MAELLDDIRRRIDGRLRELRPLVQEAQELERALDALTARAPNAGNGRTRRAPRQRRTATRPRTPQSRTREQLVEYLREHRGSTAGDVAKALNLNRNSIATRLAQLAKAGLIEKEERGYSA